MNQKYQELQVKQHQNSFSFNESQPQDPDPISQDIIKKVYFDFHISKSNNVTYIDFKQVIINWLQQIGLLEVLSSNQNQLKASFSSYQTLSLKRFNKGNLTDTQYQAICSIIPLRFLTRITDIKDQIIRIKSDMFGTSILPLRCTSFGMFYTVQSMIGGAKCLDNCWEKLNQASQPQFLNNCLNRIQSSINAYKIQNNQNVNYLETIYNQIMQRLSWVDQIQQFSAWIKFIPGTILVLEQMQKLELFDSLVNTIKLLEKNQNKIQENSSLIQSSLNLMSILIDFFKITRDISIRTSDNQHTLNQVLGFNNKLLDLIIPKIINSFKNLLTKLNFQQLRFNSIILISKILELNYLDQEMITQFQLHELVIAQFQLMKQNYEPYILAIIKITENFFPLLNLLTIDANYKLNDDNSPMSLVGYLADKITMFFKKYKYNSQQKPLLFMMISLLNTFLQKADTELIKSKIINCVTKIKQIFEEIEDSQIRSLIWIGIRVLVNKFQRDQLQIRIIIGAFKEIAMNMMNQEEDNVNTQEAVNFVHSIYISSFSRDFFVFKEFMQLFFQGPNIWIDHAFELLNFRTLELNEAQFNQLTQTIILGMKGSQDVGQINQRHTLSRGFNGLLDIPSINKGIKLLGILLESNNGQFALNFSKQCLYSFNELMNQILQTLVSDGNMRETCIAEQLLQFKEILQKFYLALHGMMQDIPNSQQLKRTLQQLLGRFMENIKIIEFQKSDISIDGRQIGSWNKITHDLLNPFMFEEKKFEEEKFEEEKFEEKKDPPFEINARCVITPKNEYFNNNGIKVIRFGSLIFYATLKMQIAKQFGVDVLDIQNILFQMNEDEMQLIQNEDTLEVMISHLKEYKDIEKINSVYCDFQIELSEEFLNQLRNNSSSEKVRYVQCNYCGKVKQLKRGEDLQGRECEDCREERQQLLNKL